MAQNRPSISPTHILTDDITITSTTIAAATMV